MSGYRDLGVSLIRCNAVDEAVDGRVFCVQRNATTIGHVGPVLLPSHVRRGRMQTSPQWIAGDRDGRPLNRPLFQRQLDAIVAVIDHAEGR
jgi:hypothetical protein